MKTFLAATIPLLVAPSVQAAPLKVVTTTATLASLTRAVGGSDVEVEAICVGDQDPHFIHARPSFMRLLADADLFIKIGLELEKAWEEPLLRGSRNPRVQTGTDGHLDVSTAVRAVGAPKGPVDRSAGDIHTLGNPHFWLDPYNGRHMAESIAERLSRLRPAAAVRFAAGRDRFLEALDARMFGAALVEKHSGAVLWQRELSGDLDSFLDSRGDTKLLDGWRGKLPKLRRTPIITFHTSWTYLARRFGIPVVGQLEPRPGIHPSPGHLIKIIRKVHAEKVRALVVEPYYDRKVADFVGAKTGVQVLVLPNASGPGTGLDDYLAMLDNAINALAKRSP